MTKALVLGAGQVGTFAARALTENGADVVTADLKPTLGYYARFGPQRPTPLLSLDILDECALAGMLRELRPSLVLLCAGLVGESCERSPERAWQVNVEGARRVAWAALNAQVERLVLVSTLAVYGRPSCQRISETASLNPGSVYGRTKVAAEEAVRELVVKGLDVRILRPCGVYGPLRLGAGSHSARFIEQAILAVLRSGSFTIRAGQNTSEEYLYVKDLARAIAATGMAVTSGSALTFNVGAGRKTTPKDLSEALQEVVDGAKVSVEEIDDGLPAAMPPLEVNYIRDTIGFETRYGLVDGLRDYISEAGFTR